MESVEIMDSSGKSSKYLRSLESVSQKMRTRTIQATAICEYCGKRLEAQNESGDNVDGNRMVLEIDGSRKRACRRCTDGLSADPEELDFRMPEGIG